MSQNKIFDIVPPSEGQKEELVSLKKSDERARKPLAKKNRRFPKIPFFVIGGIILIAGACYFFIKPKAEITISPKTESATFETQYQVTGKIIEADSIASQEFSSTGVKSKSVKAHGTITVYNAYSTSARTFVAKTRFVSSDGKLFRTPVKIVVPGSHYEGGKLVPGEVAVQVEADQPGENYNIGPATFSLPGLAGTASYTTIYAKSVESMVGGTVGEAPQVVQADLDKAQEILSEQALAEAKAALEDVLPSQDYILAEGASTEEVIDIIPLAEKGQEVDKFLFQVKAESQGLVFKKSDAEEFVKSFIRSQIPSEKAWQESSLAMNYSVRTLNLKESKMTLNLDISVKLYSIINESSLKGAIKNKNLNEINTIIGNTPAVSGFEIEFWPFWIKKTPKDTERITVKLNID